MGGKATRAAFGEALLKVAAKNDRVVVINADLGKSTNTVKFVEKYPDRSFNVGVAEANMIGIGTGLALEGWIPFICTFATFVAGRFETIRVSLAYNDANVKIVGTHAGIGIGEDGYSQMALEDIALMRSLPNMVVMQPGDAVETEGAVQYIVEHHGPVFLRLTRQKVEDVNPPDYRFEFGKGVILDAGKGEGRDLTIMATGGTVYNAQQAARELRSQGLDVRAVNIHTIKPIDQELILDSIQRSGRILTVEDHGLYGGLGSAVSEAVAERGEGMVRRIAVRGFGESGDQGALYSKFGLSTENIVAEAKKLVKKD
ncbi:MAG: transketolase C-terminal domain-containing protein [candidate division NC10 bacterium]|jgi:transketolase|nr:transketolase family protein [candidate division NC10 bacterium]